MKNTDVNLNSLITIGNQMLGFIPALMKLAYFVALVFLLAKVWQARKGNISTTELAAVCIAFGLAMK